MTWSTPGMEAIARVVRDRAGLVFVDARRDGAEAVMRGAMRRLGIGDPTEYAAVIASGGPALEELIAGLTVGETYFFREPAQFDFLRETVLPEVARRRGAAHTIRAWSAGCAAGEEAYSIAVVALEAGFGDRVRVVGTEISRPRLAAARHGRYTRWSLRGVADPVVQRYFTTEGSRLALDPAIRAAVEFRYLNLAEDTYPSSASGVWGMDVILCRNVLIYFDAETVAQVARRLVDTLAEGGWLLLGASDPPLAGIVACDVVTTGAGLAYRRRRAGRSLDASVVESVIPESIIPEIVIPTVPRAESVTAAHAPPNTANDRVPGPRREVLRAEAERLYAAHDYVAAAGRARDALALDPGDAALWVVYVRSLANAGQLEEAGRACARALDHHPMSAELVYLHSLLLAESGCYAESAAAARQALYLDRTLVVAHLALGAALARLDDTDGARRAYANAEHLLRALPGDAPVPAADGETAWRLMQIARAQHALLTGVVG